MSSTATVFSLPSREAPAPDGAEVRGGENSFQPSLRPIGELLIVIDDAELEALAKLFAMSPVRQAMTFEAYLAVKGFARTIPKRARSRL
jgi:hypothetical protein